MSFFDDGEETAQRPSRPAGPPASAAAAPPRPRRPQHAGGGVDQHTVTVRRRVAAGVAVVLLILIVLLVNACKKSQEQQSLKDYNHNVSQIAHESDEQVAKAFFSALAGAGGKPALDVQVQVDQLRIQAQTLAAHAKSLSVPGDMTAAQRALVEALDFRVEALTKIAALMPAALGGQSTDAIPKLAGDMEIFLASDVLFSQRVLPLIQQTLSSHSIHGLTTTGSRFLPNLGWLEPNTVQQRISGHSSSTSNQTVTGNHGSSLVSTSVGANTLAAEPTLNHISGGGSPTFTVALENSGESPETNVKVDVTVTAGGKQYKASHVVNQTQPGSKVNVEIPVSGVSQGVAGKVEVNIEGVPGENDLENNKSSYLAIFGP